MCLHYAQCDFSPLMYFLLDQSMLSFEPIIYIALQLYPLDHHYPLLFSIGPPINLLQQSYSTCHSRRQPCTPLRPPEGRKPPGPQPEAGDRIPHNTSLCPGLGHPQHSLSLLQVPQLHYHWGLVRRALALQVGRSGVPGGKSPTLLVVLLCPVPGCLLGSVYPGGSRSILYPEK